MSYIYLDESGDLGLNFDKKGSTEHFIITALFSEKPRSIEKCVKKVREGISKKLSGPLHAHKESPIVRKRLLHCLLDRECKAMVIILQKRKLYSDPKDEKIVLYNYVTNILIDRIFSKKILGDIPSVTIVASRKETNRFLNKNFTDYIEASVKRHGIGAKVLIKAPHQEIPLQAVDFVSWAIFRKYEHKDESYYKIIKGMIVEENDLY